VCAIVPVVLLSPALAFLLALAAEIAVWALLEPGDPALALIGSGSGDLLLLRRLRVASRRAPSGEA
jgi:hypothetical protein